MRHDQLWPTRTFRCRPSELGRADADRIEDNRLSVLVGESASSVHAGNLLDVERAEVDAKRAEDGREVRCFVLEAGHCVRES